MKHNLKRLFARLAAADMWAYGLPFERRVDAHRWNRD